MATFKKGQSGNPRGRKPGVPNKVTGQLRDMILQALADAGGTTYLATQAHENPGPFLALVGKVLPLQVGAEGTGRLLVEWQQSPTE